MDIYYICFKSRLRLCEISSPQLGSAAIFTAQKQMARWGWEIGHVGKSHMSTKCQPHTHSRRVSRVYPGIVTSY